MCCSCRNAQERVVVENNTLNSAMCAQEPWACRNPLLEGGGFGPGGGTAAATGAGVAIGEALTNDKEQPNTGANWTYEEKAELGGAGSGTPGGWEPQDEENARNNRASTAPSKDRLNEAASASNRNGLTDAGRALQKHGGREGSAYSYSSQKASVLNQEAQNIVNEILNNPNTKIESRVVFENKQRITVVEATAPDGRALRFNSDGSRLIGFREPPTKQRSHMLEYSVGSSVDREDLYAELSFNRVQWGEISLSEDRKSVNIIIYPDESNILEFQCDEFLQLIEKAKSHLLRLEPLSK